MGRLEDAVPGARVPALQGTGAKILETAYTLCSGATNML